MKPKLIRLLWLSLIVAAVTGMRSLMARYSLSEMQSIINQHYYVLLGTYLLVISIRGLFFIPTLPIIIVMASTLQPALMFSTTLAASLLSCYLVCLAVDHLDMQKRLDRFPQKSVTKAQGWIQRIGVPAVTGWAFFPFVFTELIVYLARISGMKRKHVVFAAGVGEGLLIIMVIYVTEWFVGFTL